jgi:hypothetical protein
MHMGGGSKRGFLYILSSSLVRDPKELITCSHTKPFTIAKASSPFWRGSSPYSPMPVPLLCMSYSSNIVTSLNIQGDRTSSSLTMPPLLLVYSLDTLLLKSCLFNDLSPYVLLSNTTLSPTHPPGVVSFIFILGPIPHLSPLSIFFPRSYIILSSLAQLFLCISRLFLSFVLLVPFSPHLISTSSGSS